GEDQRDGGQRDARDGLPDGLAQAVGVGGGAAVNSCLPKVRCSMAYQTVAMLSSTFGSLAHTNRWPGIASPRLKLASASINACSWLS
ncbi:hypothetical protein, partial [Streptomyces sp. NPDC023588]|uniref:hypothetical protein n=1 Tax=Streptomyces sp. NPDC023588 TaxID=3154907 RepID=UPI0033FE98AA